MDGVCTLIITDSWDVTSDIVVRRLGESAFRLNTDIIVDYHIDWSRSGFTLANPTGHSICSRDVRSVYWRKPFTSSVYDASGHPDAFFYSECRYIVRELYNSCRAAGANALVEEGAERRLGKIRQLKIAERHFMVPNWRVSLGSTVIAPENTIVKSVSGEPLSPDLVLYTSRVDGMKLDSGSLWFMQRAIQKSADVTVVWVDSSVFAFRCAKYLESVDWRERILEMRPDDWEALELVPAVQRAIGAFMQDCGLRFGRLDFVEEGNDLFFLEVNPNGQWAWLDIDGKAGLMDAMIKAIEG